MSQMVARFRFMVSLPICILSGNEIAHAQDARAAQMLPPVVVSPKPTGAKPGRAENASRVVRRPPPVVVYPTTPIAGSGIDPEKVPASINIVDTREIARTDSLNITDALQQQVPGVIIS